MLRVLVVLLLAVNALFFAWTQGWLDNVVGPARPEREPQRMAAQVRPELVQILPPVGASAASNAASSAAPEVLASASGVGPGSAASAGVSAGASAAAASLPVVPKPGAPAASASAAPSAVPPASPTPSAPPSTAVVSTAAAPTATTRATAASTASAASPSPVLDPAASAPVTAVATSGSNVCLEAGPYTPAEVNAAEAALKPLLASGGWVQRKTSSGGEWMIYMGPYPDRESMDRKKAELARIRGGVPQEELSAPPELARGLSLGRFPSPAAANATLAQYRLRGIRTARVVQSSSGAPVVYLRVAQADPAIAARLTALKPPPAGRAFSACPR